MIRHIFKIIWKQRRKNLLLIVELAFIYILLFLAFPFIIANIARPMQQNRIVKHDVLQFDLDQFRDSAMQTSEFRVQVLNVIKSFPGVKDAGFTDGNGSGQRSLFFPVPDNIESDNMYYSGTRILTRANYGGLMNYRMSEGRWCDEDRSGMGITECVISSDLKEILFGEGYATGRKFRLNTNPYDPQSPMQEVTVAGVVEFNVVPLIGNLTRLPFVYLYDSEVNSRIVFCIDENGGFDKDNLEKILSRITGDDNAEIRPMGHDLKNSNAENWADIGIFLKIVLFLLLNVFLCLGGLLWFSVRRRYSEIGIRHALGSQNVNIFCQFTGETLVITTLGILAGLIFTIQSPLLKLYFVWGYPFNVSSFIYWMAMLLSALVLYLVSAISAFFPAWQASVITPAEALRSHD
jgi:putative ABC transport system permease protein